MKLLVLTFLCALPGWANSFRTMDNVDRLVALRANLSVEDSTRVIDKLKTLSLEQGTGHVEDFGGGFLRVNLTSTGVALVEQWPEVTAVETEGGVEALAETKEYRVRLSKDLDDVAIEQLRALLSNVAGQTQGAEIEYFKRFRIVAMRLTSAGLERVRNTPGVTAVAESDSEFKSQSCEPNVK